MLYVAHLHAYAVLHVCECKDKARQSKNKEMREEEVEALYRPIEAAMKESDEPEKREKQHDPKQEEPVGIRHVVKPELKKEPDKTQPAVKI